MFLRHRTFIAPKVFTPRGTREAVRLIAERFANEVGAEHVVAIVEHAEPFSIVVWFRSTEAERGLASRVYLTHGDIRAIIKQSPEHAFPLDELPRDTDEQGIQRRQAE